MTEWMLEVENVVKVFEDNEVVRKISLKLQRGEIGCLLGPSGCGF